jgi:hypothetical protein
MTLPVSFGTKTRFQRAEHCRGERLQFNLAETSLQLILRFEFF